MVGKQEKYEEHIQIMIFLSTKESELNQYEHAIQYKPQFLKQILTTE